jgi:hypothetical protein
MDEDIDMPPPGGEDMMDKYFGEEGAVMKVGDEKEVGKQGLKKKLLKKGEGWDAPEVGDEVEGTRAPAPSDWISPRQRSIRLGVVRCLTCSACFDGS